tara:strand:- start:5720 stop:6622 length:903 start_codon:yes stop_codon:yes gene_type:complete
MANNTENMDQMQGQQPEQSTANDSGLQEDIFTEIFGGPAVEEFVATDTTEQQPDFLGVEPSEPVQAPVDPKDDNSQFQYWQSQADKRQGEIDELKTQVAALSAQREAPQEPARQEIDKVEKPIKPRKPAGFSHSEALDDPESDSAKYLSQKDQYVDDLAEYMEYAETQREQSAAIQERNRQMALRNQQVMTELQSKYSYTAPEAADFVEVMNDPSSLSLDNLVQLHQIRRGDRANAGQVINREQRPDVQQKVAQMENRQRNLTVPQPLGVQPGANVQSNKKVEDQMMDSMIGNFQKKNPF